MLTHFQNSFTVKLGSKFLIVIFKNITPHLKHVATVPCEISMLQNRHAQEVIE